MGNNSPGLEIRALVRNIRMSAHKARRVINQIHGCSYGQALMILELMPYGAFYPISQLIHSAAANENHNMGLNKANLLVSRVEVNEGVVFKRVQPVGRLVVVIDVNPSHGFWTRRLMKLFGHEGK
jgi:large subunit ribosomal protein L22